MNLDEKLEELKGKAKEQTPKKNERFIKLAPKTKIEIAEWRNIMGDHFPDLLFAAEAGLSVIGQLLIDDIKNPFALVYVDVPSSGKTITLNFFSTIKELIYTTDNFTPAAFVSHAANRSEKNLVKIDLLPKIQYRAMMVRDLAPIFARREEDVQAMLGILIRVLDGEGYETDSGLHGKRGYIGDYLFMLLAASTPIRPRIWKIMGNLGSRLFFLNINGKEKDETELANQLINSCRDKEIMCREATEELIKTLWKKYPNGISWNKEKDDQRLREIIARFASVLARLRSPMNTEEEYSNGKKYTHHQSDPEMPDRLNQLLYNFARGYALVCGRENINHEDIKATMRIALDSAPPNRAKIFKHLIYSDGKLNTNEVMQIIDCSRPVALRLMKELAILKIVSTEGNMDDESEPMEGRPRQRIILRDKYSWFISEECKELTNYTDRT